MPFTPYIVLFCHVIETSDTEDLERLRAFNESLEPYELPAGSCYNLRQLFASLLHVARVYVDFTRAQAPDVAVINTSEMSQRDGGNANVNSSTTTTSTGLPAATAFDDSAGAAYATGDNGQLDLYLRQMGMLPPENWNEPASSQPNTVPSSAFPTDLSSVMSPVHGTPDGPFVGADRDSKPASAGVEMMFDMDTMAVSSNDYYSMNMSGGGGDGTLPQQTSYLADWFSGNQQIMGMMDEGF